MQQQVLRAHAHGAVGHVALEEEPVAACAIANSCAHCEVAQVSEPMYYLPPEKVEGSRVQLGDLKDGADAPVLGDNALNLENKRVGGDLVVD